MHPRIGAPGAPGPLVSRWGMCQDKRLTDLIVCGSVLLQKGLPMAAFPDVHKIKYEGPSSTNPMAFRWYNENEIVEGKSMKDQLRFSVAYWHTMRGTGGDPFGPGTMLRPWEAAQDSVPNACNRVRVAFEFMEKLGAPFFCFHDRDVAPEGKNLAETNRNLDAVVRVIKEEMQRTGIKLLWGTANLFSNQIGRASCRERV